ncbi:MAG: hypothetical protein ACR2RB_00070 [Gammaproteobacteria bacterium]
MKRMILYAGMSILIAPHLCSAAEFGFPPRLKTGLQHYDYEQKAFVSPARDPAGIFPNVSSDQSFSDTLPFVGGGLTFFANRFFVDLEIQQAFDGNDDSRLINQNFLDGAGPMPVATVLNTNTAQSADFDRTDFAVSLGYSVTDNFVVFAGYKRAETDFESDLNGTISGFQANDLAPIPFLTGTFTGKLDQEFDYDGPFVGANYTWDVGLGALSGNIAVAAMDATVDLTFSDVLVTTVTGAVVPVDLQGLGESQGRGSFSDIDGDTIGLSLGLLWTGLTPVDALTYSLGVAGYRYDFESSGTPDFSETQIRFDVGVAYAFEFGS